MSFTTYKQFAISEKEKQKIIDDLKKFNWGQIKKELEEEDEQERRKRALNAVSYTYRLYQSTTGTTIPKYPLEDIGFDFNYNPYPHKAMPVAPVIDDSEEVDFEG